jgi:UDP-N-acetyl-2-amino-2-deoxyglucuronate dehydrogenase
VGPELDKRQGKLRFGIIGAGVAAETHSRELAHVGGASLISVFARDANKAAAFAEAYSVPQYFFDLDAFLSDPCLDAVIITTPNGLHLDYAIAAAEARKHVIVEKPLEINEARARQIVDACKSFGVKLFVIYQRRYSAAAAQALDDITSGRIGKVILVNIVDNQYRKPSYYQNDAWRGTHAVEGGGCVITQSTHLIDLAQYLVGGIRSVFARTSTAYHSIETEDVAAATFEFEGGAIGTFSSSTAAYPGQRHLVTISGTKGTIIINGEHDQVVFRRIEAESRSSELPADFSFSDPVDPRSYPTFGQRKQLQVITDALLENRQEQRACDQLSTVRVIDALYRSAANNAVVDL